MTGDLLNSEIDRLISLLEEAKRTPSLIGRVEEVDLVGQQIPSWANFWKYQLTSPKDTE